MLLPVEAVLQASGEHSLAEIADEAGLAQDVVARRLEALGLGRPQAETVFHDAPAAARALCEIEDSGMPDESIDAICRVAGRAMNVTSLSVRDLAGSAYMETGDTEYDLGLRYAAAARRLIPVLVPLLRFTLTMHQLRLVRSDVVSRAERAAGALPTGREVTVGFADLAGFTPLGEELTVEELGHLVRHFEDVVGKTTPTGAHHVKTIGDAAMIVADDPEAVLHVLVELVRTASEHEVGLPPIHAGMAVGRAVTREGDWHGSPVNIASRLADAAPAGRVFATEAARRAAGDGAAWTDAGTRRLKGVDEAIRVFCLAPAASDQR